MPSSDTQFKPTHGMSIQPDGKRSRTYTTWRVMHQRCKYLGHKSYNYYGGKGVSVCERWDSFSAFLDDMGERPKGMTLGRKDNSLGYLPENCQWETHKQQARNRCSNRFIEAFDQRKTIAEWAEEYGIRGDTLTYRIDVIGMAAEIALTHPVSKTNRGLNVYRVTK